MVPTILVRLKFIYIYTMVGSVKTVCSLGTDPFHKPCFELLNQCQAFLSLYKHHSFDLLVMRIPFRSISVALDLPTRQLNPKMMSIPYRLLGVIMLPVPLCILVLQLIISMTMLILLDFHFQAGYHFQY